MIGRPNRMPTPTWATDRVSAEVEGFVRHRASVSANEIANELKIGHQFAVSALKELQNRGVVGRSDAEGQCHVLRRGDISILTRRKTEELLRLMKHSRYETTLRPDRVILIDRETGSEDTFFELEDLEFFCCNQKEPAEIRSGSQNRRTNVQEQI